MIGDVGEGGTNDVHLRLPIPFGGENVVGCVGIEVGIDGKLVVRCWNGVML